MKGKGKGKGKEEGKGKGKGKGDVLSGASTDAEPDFAGSGRAAHHKPQGLEHDEDGHVGADVGQRGADALPDAALGLRLGQLADADAAAAAEAAVQHRPADPPKLISGAIAG